MEMVREPAEDPGGGRPAGGPTLSAEDAQLLEALRAGDEAAFARLVARYQPMMLRLALVFVPSRAVAEEVVQDAWIGVLQGLRRFEGRSSLKTWMFRILTNRARTRGEREGRTLSFADLAAAETEHDEPAVDPGAFWPPDHPQWPNGWVSYPARWDHLPEDRALSAELQAVIREAIDALPPSQRTVITMRDVGGWASDEVCNALGISESNQRVLLHRARVKVRRAIEQYQSRA
ncbi:MAG TPA: sigma-70 family RNA polymerase sigma factor [Roseiflexaceae bacterium]|nr:sigma-70 family RNA polymerase sigma factor [Roseiflexaceae bacterium]